MTSTSEAARQAQHALSMARDEYARAVLAALEHVSVQQLARELGVSRQAVNQLRQRHTKGER